MYICVCVCVLCVRMRVCVCVCMCACMNVCINVHMYTSMFIQFYYGTARHKTILVIILLHTDINGGMQLHKSGVNSNLGDKVTNSHH